MRRIRRLALLALSFAPMAQAQQVRQIDEMLVEYHESRIDVAGRTIEFTGGVKATYGETVVYADRLEVDMEAARGVAEGAVRLEDPDGMMTARRLEFNWRDRTGNADEAAMMVGNVRLTVRRIEVAPDKWTLYDVLATPCGERSPAIKVSSRKVVLRPGRSGRAESPKLSLFGASLGTIPFTDRFSLDSRASGWRLPSVTSRRGEGLGVSWTSSFLLGQQTALNATYLKFPKSVSSYGAGLAWSAVPPTRASGLLYPRTELAERFSESAFDNVGSDGLAAEEEYLGTPRQTVAASSLWNQVVRGRWIDTNLISKRIEVAAEAGGAFQGGVGFVQARYQSLRPDERTPFRDRLALHASGATRRSRLARGLDARLRIDLGAYSDGFGWARASTAITFRPAPSLALGAAWVAGASAGTPRYAFDRLYSQKALHLRGDAKLGPLTLAGLFKYDMDQRRWYDHEYSVALVAGCFEPFIAWRQFPNDLKFGARIRLGSLSRKLSQREFRRSAEPRRITER